MINSVVLAGRITKELELKKTQNNKSYLNFNLAVNRKFKNENGDNVADFPSIICWNKTAEYLANYAHQGDLISVEGSIQTRSYEKEGRLIYVTEIVANEVHILAAKKESNEKYFNAEQIIKGSEKAGRSNMTIGNEEISPDDLPFY